MTTATMTPQEQEFYDWLKQYEDGCTATEAASSPIAKAPGSSGARAASHRVLYNLERKGLVRQDKPEGSRAIRYYAVEIS